jgi:hypothetical protein
MFILQQKKELSFILYRFARLRSDIGLKRYYDKRAFDIANSLKYEDFIYANQ